MITRKNIKLLKEINNLQKKKGVATAGELKTFSKSRKYQALDKMQTLDLIKQNKAPKKVEAEKTFTITQLGKKILEKYRKLEKHQKQKPGNRDNRVTA